ncbi:ribonuclease T [Falsochrobactrum sp. TDYN1]|uniref:Ribonuclease T n=1 Tax=Falsochrobactrum tianjinense TaxID=2706015 RepID=A0A949PKD0_9HYPH|nr:ribonuclease T [Falsochrobactrum sp. TDYN1]MBV2142732.1 ribonuclease T [Falsochrobactrum sp. TDYN1]
MLRKLAVIPAAVIATALAVLPVTAQDRSDSRPGDFDFYVLALSWSPSYCTLEGQRANKQQCSKNKPSGFVVHGLWPQNEWGYPANCSFDNSRSRGNYVPRHIISRFSDIMPSAGLAAYQWRKHGSCSGLTQNDYFATMRDARRRVNIPPSLRNLASGRRVEPLLVEKAFIAANPGIKAGGISVSCKRNYLQEVRICMSKDLKFRDCKQVDANACRSRTVLMPSTR